MKDRLLPRQRTGPADDGVFDDGPSAGGSAPGNGEVSGGIDERPGQGFPAGGGVSSGPAAEGPAATGERGDLSELEELSDDLEQALLQARTLIESTVLKHRDRSSRRCLVSQVPADDAAISTAVGELIAQATTSVDVVFAIAPEATTPLQTAIATLPADTGRGIRVRVLCNQAALDSGVLPWPSHAGDQGRDRDRRTLKDRTPKNWAARDHSQDHRDAGDSGQGDPYDQAQGSQARDKQTQDDLVQVRIARIPMLSAVVVDGTTALACAESAAGRRASVIRAPAVIRTLQTFFDDVWHHAVVAAERISFGDRARTEITRQVLEKLRAGVTDEVAARDLAVSVRTYRRYVAEIMTLLGASSRFQAGVRAAELGLSGARAPRGAPPSARSVP
ncbi:DNA-binding response regulator [Streptomyces sp. NPDC048483]|uniref:helix-turn-helix transcriptional regulator n=1 Tax=Streptomyces sp. NPDC048483 TaxID=3154927 RepID=UPI0034282698